MSFSEADTLAQAEQEQGGPGRLSRQHDRRGADHPQGNPVALVQRRQDRAGEVVCRQLRSHDGGFIDLIVDYDLSSAHQRCGGIEVVGNLEISVYFRNKLAAGLGGFPMQRAYPVQAREQERRQAGRLPPVYPSGAAGFPPAAPGPDGQWPCRTYTP